MKSTGIVRRIDNLGRIVIPKELRKNLRIIENDMVELYMEKDYIVLKKFSNLLYVSNYIQNIIDVINSNYKCNIFVTDNSNIIAYSGIGKKKYINKEISEYLLNILKNQTQVIENDYVNFSILRDGENVKTNYLIFPIVVFGNISGLLTIFDYDNLDNIKELGNIIAKILELQNDYN